jgi:spore coat protein CotH
MLSGYQKYFGGFSRTFDAGIELRGRSASSRPKKSYGFEILTDSFGTDKKNASLLNMRNDDDWILDAMYIDKARMRNKVSMDLWGDICTLSSSEKYIGKPYTESRFVELFINMDYKGLYCLSERFDRKQLNLERSEESPDGLLYKTEYWSNTTRFISLADTTANEYWDGWEQKYPATDDYIYWYPIYNFSEFVVNSTDEEFRDHITDYLDISNMIDYFIFINTCQAFDNMGTNMFYARNDRNSPFVIYPWDLDASWGRNWDSTLLSATIYLSNKFIERMYTLNVENCTMDLKEHWNYLRSELISVDDLIHRYKINGEIIRESGAFFREKNRWHEMNLDLEQELEYIELWTEVRIRYLDDLFDDFESRESRW